MADTVLDVPELALIAEALRERHHLPPRGDGQARQHGRPTARLRDRAQALIERLSLAAKRPRPSRRFRLADIKVMRLALFERFRSAPHDAAARVVADKLTRLVKAKEITRRPENQVRWVGMIPYLGFNLLAIAGIFVFPPHWQDLVLCASLYVVRMFAVGGGLHRYFSHKSYSTSRVFQFLLALLATTCGQQGPIWWASQHRHHHRFSDTPEDFHSPSQRGFLWAHQLWQFTDRAQRTDPASVRDLLEFPELRWLDRFWALPHLGLILILFAAGGLRAVEWGFCVSTLMLWQVSFSVNSLAHLIGRRRFETSDTSRNSWILALLTLGDGWHNNHHSFPGSARAGFYWWEVDVTGYVIRALAWVGIVWNVRAPPKHLLELGKRTATGVADLTSTPSSPELSSLAD